MTGDGTRDGGRSGGPLPALLVVLAFATGVTFLELGLFVAAMTGNVLIVGLGLAGHGMPLAAAVLSLGCFAAGAACGGRVLLRRFAPGHRGRVLAAGTAVQTVLTCAAAAVATWYGFTASWARWPVLGLLACATGWGYAVARGLRVSGVNTTVVTTTLASLAAERGTPSGRRRRLGSLCALPAGALAAGLLRQAFSPAVAMWAAAGVLAGCTVALCLAVRRPGAERWR